MTVTNDFVLFLECTDEQWDAWKKKIPMTQQCFNELADLLYRINLLEEMMQLYEDFPEFAARRCESFSDKKPQFSSCPPS